MYSRAQANSFVSPDDSLVPAMAKRTHSQMSSEVVEKECPVTAIQDVDTSLLTVKQTGLNEKGMPVFSAKYDKHRLILNLTKKWLQVKWRIEPSMYDDQDAKNLKVTLVVDDETAATLQKIEDAVKPYALQKVEDHMTKTTPPSSMFKGNDLRKWHTSINQNLFTAKVSVVSKTPSYLTQFKVRPFQKDVVAVAGKEQLQPLLDEHWGFMRAKAKVVVSLDSIYALPGQPYQSTVGIFWKIQQIMVDLPEQPERENIRWVIPDVFVDASWDDEE